jgi:hypothetical protein
VRCTLSFNRQPFYCIVPWSGVYALVGEDGQVTVWPSELPPELMQPNESAATGSPATQAVRSRKPKDKSAKKTPRTAPSLVPAAPVDSAADAAPSADAQPALAVAASDGSSSAAGPSGESSGEDAPKRFTRSGRELPPWLRVVK